MKVNGKEKRNPISCFVFLRKKKEKGMHHCEFLYAFSEKRKTYPCSEFLLVSFRKGEICYSNMISHSLVGERTMKSTKFPFYKIGCLVG